MNGDIVDIYWPQRMLSCFTELGTGRILSFTRIVPTLHVYGENNKFPWFFPKNSTRKKHTERRVETFGWMIRSWYLNSARWGLVNGSELITIEKRIWFRCVRTDMQSKVLYHLMIRKTPIGDYAFDSWIVLAFQHDRHYNASGEFFRLWMPQWHAHLFAGRQCYVSFLHRALELNVKAEYYSKILCVDNFKVTAPSLIRMKQRAFSVLLYRVSSFPLAQKSKRENSFAFQEHANVCWGRSWEILRMNATPNNNNLSF